MAKRPEVKGQTKCDLKDPYDKYYHDPEYPARKVIWGPTLEKGLWEGPVGDHLVAGASPKQNRPPVGPPPRSCVYTYTVYN